MEQQLVGQTLNNQISAVNSQWSRNDLWDSFSLGGRVSPMHQALSGIIAVIGDQPAVVVAADVELGDDTYETTSFDVTVWSDDVLVRVVRSGGDDAPVVSVMPRSALTGLEILRAPIITTSGFQARDERAALRLTYPDQAVTLAERDGSRLISLLPSFIQDLQAR